MSPPAAAPLAKRQLERDCPVGDKAEARHRRRTPVSLGHRRPVAGLDPDASSWAKASAVTLGVIVSCAQFGSIVSERSAIARSPASACWNAQGQLTQEVVSSRSAERLHRQ